MEKKTPSAKIETKPADSDVKTVEPSAAFTPIPTVQPAVNTALPVTPNNYLPTDAPVLSEDRRIIDLQYKVAPDWQETSQGDTSGAYGITTIGAKAGTLLLNAVNSALFADTQSAQDKLKSQMESAGDSPIKTYSSQPANYFGLPGFSTLADAQNGNSYIGICILGQRNTYFISFCDPNPDKMPGEQIWEEFISEINIAE